MPRKEPKVEVVFLKLFYDKALDDGKTPVARVVDEVVLMPEEKAKALEKKKIVKIIG